MLKVAVVGVGGISGAHIPVWEEMEDAELIALCDIRPEQMEKYENINHYYLLLFLDYLDDVSNQLKNNLHNAH